MHRIHLPLLIVLLSLPACESAAIAVAGADAASVTVLGRDMVDVGVSAVTGKDCSVVRLDKGQTYCAPREHLPGPPTFCSQTLGTVQCWANPEIFGNEPHELADTPSPTADQVRNVAARWPKSLNLGD
jgi:hypothetical protein